MVRVDSGWELQPMEFADDEDVAAPYWERPAGPTWWCHVSPGHPSIDAWLAHAQCLHPAASVALRDESRLISERTKHLFYEELLFAGGIAAPKSVHEVVAHLALRLSRWDDRRNHEDLTLLSVILNQEIRRLSTEVIRVKWSLHAREEIVFELLQHLRGATTRSILEGTRKSTGKMIEEQEAVCSRLFTIQDVVQSVLGCRSLRVTHNLAVFGGCGLVLSTITGLFGINVDGIPGADQTPYAFGLSSAPLFVLGIILIGVGMLYLGLKRPITEEQVEVRKLELQELVAKFQHDAEPHAKVGQGHPRKIYHVLLQKCR